MICDRRMIVGGEIHATDASDHAAHLFKRATLAEGIDGAPNKPVLHGENGSTLKARQCAGHAPLARRQTVVFTTAHF